MSDILIYAMSTMGKLNMERFNELFRHVYMPASSSSDTQTDYIPKNQTIRMLDALGYCEFDFDNRKVYMNNPTLILLPNFGLPKALLVGARSPKIIADIKIAVHDRREKTDLKQVSNSEVNSTIPNTITIQATSKNVIQEIAEQVGIGYDITSPAAWNLAVVSAALDDITNALKFEEFAEPSWDKSTFVKKQLKFTSSSVTETNQQLTKYHNPVTKQWIHWIWNGSTRAEISLDWGRYMVLADTESNILIYDERLFNFAVPVTVPLPCLLARAAALCSGKPPSFSYSGAKAIGNIPPNHPYHIYTEVPPEIAELIAKKLNQKPIYKSFPIDKKGVMHA
ncbi:MAG: hypothetical protein IH948_02680 [Bacteroidetes bacterium]|nr:hypothetical protein [Bacteroidota bacterium]